MEAAEHKKTTLTNAQINDMVNAHREFNPPNIEFRAKNRLGRNMRRLVRAQEEYDFLRIQLMYSHIKDKEKKPENPQASLLTPSENIGFQPEIKKLLQQTQEVELHPLFLYSTKNGGQPSPGQEVFSIDEDEILEHLTPGVRAALIDFELVEA